MLDVEMARVDIEEGHSTEEGHSGEEGGNVSPRAWQMQGFDSVYMKEWFDAQPSAKKRRICKERIIMHISKINAVNDVIPKSLYTAEEDVNGYESKVAWELSALSNIRWWHRNISRKGFAINGAVTAYPDLIVMTESGKLLLVETKGDVVLEKCIKE